MWQEAGNKITWKVKTFEEDCNVIEGVVHLRKQSRLEWEDEDSVLDMVCNGEEKKEKTAENEKPKKVLQGGVFISIQFWTLVIFFQTLERLILETSQVRISSQMDICIPI